jgi:DNA-binding CsgD family transcriptional regulator
MSGKSLPMHQRATTEDQIILDLKAEGKSLRQIGTILNISHEAVRKRLKAINGKTQVSTNPEDRKVTASTIEKEKVSTCSKPGKSTASGASGYGVNLKGTPTEEPGGNVNPPPRPIRGPERGKKTASQEVCSRGDDLLSSIRELVEAGGIEFYPMKSDAYEGYQMKHNGQIIRLYVQRKIGVDKAKEETE